MRGNVRYGIVPPVPPRKLTATSPRNQQPRTTDAVLRGHWIGIAIFGFRWVAIGCAVGHMQRDADDARTTGPHWEPGGNELFRELVRE
eukprot:7108651-Pyramimonas_sp.AAC.1